MGLFDIFRGGGMNTPVKMPAKFTAKIARKTAGEDLVFEAAVRGFFFGKAGKPEFVVEEVTVVGIPNMNLTSFFPKELEEIKKYALRVEYPRLLGLKAPE